MKKYLMERMVVSFVSILLVFVCVGVANANEPNKPVTYYVNDDATGENNGTSWQDAFTDLQDALDAAVSGDEIWVAAGTYKPTVTVDRAATFSLKSGVAIYGGFEGYEKALRERSLDPSLTVLSGDIGTVGDDTDNSYHVVYADGVTDAVLDGFTVTCGRGSGLSLSGKFAGAGMYNENSSLTVANCTFSDNRVAVVAEGYGCRGFGAGMYNHNSAPIVSNCTFIANLAGNTSIYATGRGGGMYNEGYFVTDENDARWPLVIGCTFRDNTAAYASLFGGFEIGEIGGGGMYNDSCDLTVDSCTFAGNLGSYGGGMLNYGGYPTITNCIFNTNSVSYYDGYGGAIFNIATASIVNCTFYQNGWRLMPEGYPAPLFRPYTSIGGAIYDHRRGSTITNCIFSENTALTYGGAVVSDATRYPMTTLTNCLFYENKSWQGKYAPAYERTDHVAGNINLNSVNNLYDIDPLLVDPESGDFHLWYDSPCIDAGYSLNRGFLPCPSPWGLSTIDFEGDNRIVDGDGDGGPTADIGVDEFIPNLPDLRAFLEDLADSEELDEVTATRLLDYADAAQAALDEDEEETAVSILNELIADVWESLGETDTAQVIEMKTEVVIEEI